MEYIKTLFYFCLIFSPSFPNLCSLCPSHPPLSVLSSLLSHVCFSLAVPWVRSGFAVLLSGPVWHHRRAPPGVQCAARLGHHPERGGCGGLGRHRHPPPPLRAHVRRQHALPLRPDRRRHARAPLPGRHHQPQPPEPRCPMMRGAHEGRTGSREKRIGHWPPPHKANHPLPHPLTNKGFSHIQSIREVFRPLTIHFFYFEYKTIFSFPSHCVEFDVDW